MRFPAVQGVIERRLLVNFRADPAAVSRLLPPPFEPIVVGGGGDGGCAIVGICLIRLAGIRPAFLSSFGPALPERCGLRSENAAHRIAVRWRDGNQNGSLYKEGVYIPRRDSSSRFNALVGGRLFPGLHHRAAFRVEERLPRLDIGMKSEDGSTNLEVRGRVSEAWPAGSVFKDLAEASAFFERGSFGYSATKKPGTYDGLELRCRRWAVEPVDMESVRSSFFEDAEVLPRGSVEFDCALLMRNIAHEWHGRGQMCCEEACAAA